MSAVPPRSATAQVGIIANPASGKDIRRLVAHATSVDTLGKVAIIRRVLLGLAGMGVVRTLIMPDTHRLGEKALDDLEGSATGTLEVTLLDMPVTDGPADSERAAELMAAAGVGCIVALGGDGTLRDVSKGAGEVPILPISTGTNNVLPTFVDGTIAGLAAGALATGRIRRRRVLSRHKWIQVILNESDCDRALIDAVLLRGTFKGARAIWNAADIRQVVVTRGSPSTIGMSAIVGAVRPTPPHEPTGVSLSLDASADGPGVRRVLVSLAPGLLREVTVASMRIIGPGESVNLAIGEASMLALDGEREHALRVGDRLQLVLREDGPWIVQPAVAMQEMAGRQLFDR